MFEHGDWWKVLAYLAPVALVMTFIRQREALEGATRFQDLTRAQKAWVFLMALSPGMAAELMGRLEGHELAGYLAEGARLRGPGQNLVVPVLREFLSFLPHDWGRAPGRGADEMTSFLSRQLDTHGEDMILQALRQHWPSPGPPPQPVGDGPAAAGVASGPPPPGAEASP